MKKAGNIYIAVIFAVMYMPLIVMVIFSFNAANSTSNFGGFSTYWYSEMLRDEATMQALKNTFVLAGTTAAVSTVLGTAAAVGIFGMKNKWFKSGILSVTNIPMMNPEIVTGVSLMLLGFGTMLIAHVTFSLPYVVLNVLPKLRQTDPHLAEAAQDLGSTPVQAFFRVVLPSIMPGIVSGALMAFTLSIDDFVISHYVSGSYVTLPLLIYSMTKKRVTPKMYAVCTCIFLSVLALLLIMNIMQIRQAKKNKKSV